MDHLSSSLGLMVTLEESLINGEGVAAALSRFCGEQEGPFVRDVQRFTILIRQGTPTEKFFGQIANHYQLAALELCAAGLQGQAILSKVQLLRKELEEIAEMDVRRHIEALPLKILVPLLLFQFPAVLIILFGPLIRQFMAAMGGM